MFSNDAVPIISTGWLMSVNDQLLKTNKSLLAYQEYTFQIFLARKLYEHICFKG